MRTKRSRKLDRARVSQERHEIRYARKLANRFLERIDDAPSKLSKGGPSGGGYFGGGYTIDSKLTPEQIARVCKLLLKVTK